MYDEIAESSADRDLGSGGAMLLPDVTDSGGTVRHLAVGAGKDGNLYVVNRDSMGKFNSSGNSQIWQQVTGALASGIFSTPAYFNGSVYYGGCGRDPEVIHDLEGQACRDTAIAVRDAFRLPGHGAQRVRERWFERHRLGT